MELTFAFVTSLLLGMRHATDADHIVAVTTVVSRERSIWRAGGLGALWGLGHTLTIFVVGGAIILFKLSLSVRLGLSLEMIVAAMLIVLGVLNIVDRKAAPQAVANFRPFLVGVVHGLAGSAGAALLILPLIDSALWATVYLVVFGIGTIVGMALVTLGIAAPMRGLGNRFAGTDRWIRVAAGALSLGFGAYLGYQIGFVDGLFLGSP